jgi:hypothetical protein
MKPTQRVEAMIRNRIVEAPGEVREFSASLDGTDVRVTLNDWDRLGVSLRKLEVRCEAGCGAFEEDEDFTAQCHTLAREVNYLEEPLRVIELDGPGRIGFIRSDPPASDDKGVAYFEIQVDGKKGTVSLERKGRFYTSREEQTGGAIIGYHLLGRLIDDFSAFSFPVRSSRKSFESCGFPC